MILVNDLRIEEDIVPLFNFTNNQYADRALKQLFKEIPTTLGDVLERQQIIAGFKENWPVINDFSYQPLYFKEVYALFGALQLGKLKTPLTRKDAFRLWLIESERAQKLSQCMQLILFLDSIAQRFFYRIDKGKFPQTFKTKLETANAFLIQFNLSNFIARIKENKFSVADIIQVFKVLSILEPEDINAFWAFFFEFEAYFSMTKGIIKQQFTIPEFSTDAFILTDFYHPLLSNPVKNSFVLQENENVILLTGPNMSGKSTLLKAVGVCVYLAHVGVGVPASGCKIPFYESIVVAINANDNLESGYSHFMTEIKNLKSVLQAANNSLKCFAIFDELFKGTNIDDAQEITRTTLKGLTNFKGSLFFISTHLLQLENTIETESTTLKKYYIECNLVNGIPQFSYTLRAGWSNLKIGKILFEAEGLTDLLKI